MRDFFCLLPRPIRSGFLPLALHQGWRWLLGGLLLCAVLTPALAIEIESALDRNPVPINESFTLTFVSEIDPDGEPDLLPLSAHFEILNVARGSQYSAVNGTLLRKFTWQIQMMAKEPGTLQIPAINFGKDRSKPLTVTVTWNGGSRNKTPGPGQAPSPMPAPPGSGSGAAPDGPGAMIELDASPKNPYVQAQVVVTVRVLSRVAFTGDLGQPEIPGILLEKLDPDRQYTAVRNGLQYRVDERRYAMFPQKSGPLTIPPVELLGEFVDPMTGMGPVGRAAQKKFRLRSDSFNVDVKPIPAAFSGKVWLPASKLSLKEAWKPDGTTVAAGDAVTRTLTIKADSVSAGVLPDLDLGVTTQDFRQYPDQPVTKEDKTGAGMTSQRDQKIALIPVGPGKFTLPAIDLPWWNTSEDRMEVAHLPARILTVTPGAAKPAAAPEPLGVVNPGSALPDGAPAIDSGAASPAIAATSPTHDRWFWVALVALSGWILTALAWFWQSWHRKGIASDEVLEVTPERGRLRVTEALKRLKKACEAGDLGAARDAVEAWSLEHWAGLTAEDRHEALRELLGTRLLELDRGLYGQEQATWDGKAFWRHLEDRLLEARRSQKKETPNLLDSLYKT